MGCSGNAHWNFPDSSHHHSGLCATHALKGMVDINILMTSSPLFSNHLSPEPSTGQFSPDCFATNDLPKEPPKKRAKKLFKSWEIFKSISSETFDGLLVPSLPILEQTKLLLQNCETELQHKDSTKFNQKDSNLLSNGKSLYVERYCGALARHGCKFSCKIVVDVEQRTAIVYKSGTHDHTVDLHVGAAGTKSSKTGTWGVPPGCREFIDLKISEGYTAKEIHRGLRDQNVLHLPDMVQLQNYIQRRRVVLMSEIKTETMADFLEWCEQNQWKPSLQDNDVFVLPGAVLPEQTQWKEKCTDLHIVVCLSTKALLRNAVSQQDSSLPPFVCFDGTYNLLANGCPTLCIGTIDWLHKYRTICVVYTTHEDQQSYEDAIDSISQGISKCFEGRSLVADYTMQDGAPAIYNAVTAKLHPKAIGSCWYHLKAQILKRKNEFASERNYIDFVADIDLLHSSQSPVEYHEGATLLVQKWTPLEPGITAWFDKEYFGWRQTFYACLTPPGIPCTNDPLENNNRLIKQFGTQHKLLTTGAFLARMRYELKHESHSVEMGGLFPTCFALDYNAWRTAQEWLELVTSDSIIPNRNKTTFFVPSSRFRSEHGAILSRSELKKFLEKRNQKVQPIRGETFDQYISRRFSFYELKPLTTAGSRSDFIRYSCTCVMYWKYAHCKHSLGVGISEKRFLIPAQYSLAAMGAKGKRGRKKRVKNSSYGPTLEL